MKEKDYYIRYYRTRWTDCDNVVISLFFERGGDTQIGIVEIKIFHGKNEGKAYIWNLHVSENHRGKGYGRALLSDALNIAMCADCKEVALEWDKRDTPQWVYDWYARNGFEVTEFGKGYAMMKKII